jgi:hypothetical protein
MQKIIFIITLTLISFLLKSQTIDTNVIFHDYIPDIVLSNPQTDTLNIDINQDGLLDLRFYIYSMSPAPEPFVKTLNGNCQISFFSHSTTDTLTSSLIHWGSGNYQWTYFNTYDRIGVKITNNTYIYYGWVKATVSGGYGSRIITIDKYAFCKIANYPFLYGQTSTITNVPIINMEDSTNVYVINNSVIIQSGKVIKNVTLTSIIGSVVASQNNVNSTSANISTAGLANGTYIVQVQFVDNSIFTKQIVI